MDECLVPLCERGSKNIDDHYGNNACKLAAFFLLAPQPCVVDPSAIALSQPPKLCGLRTCDCTYSNFAVTDGTGAVHAIGCHHSDLFGIMTVTMDTAHPKVQKLCRYRD